MIRELAEFTGEIEDLKYIIREIKSHIWGYKNTKYTVTWRARFIEVLLKTKIENGKKKNH